MGFFVLFPSCTHQTLLIGDQQVCSGVQHVVLRSTKRVCYECIASVHAQVFMHTMQLNRHWSSCSTCTAFLACRQKVFAVLCALCLGGPCSMQLFTSVTLLWSGWCRNSWCMSSLSPCMLEGCASCCVWYDARILLVTDCQWQQHHVLTRFCVRNMHCVRQLSC